MTRRLALCLFLTAATTGFGCGEDPGDDTRPVDPDPSVVVSLQHHRLTQATGISADPDSSQRYVLDGETGIFELDSAGRLTLIWERPAELPILTDLCAIGGGRFVAAADGDGYIIDMASGAARQHFCLEPGWDPGFDEEVRHVNRSVACDLENRLIYGQPQTMPRQGEPLPIRSEIASYSLVNGDDLNWIRLPEDDFYAGGMTMLPGGRVLLGAQATLSIFDPAHAGLVAEADLSFVGIQDIGGLSYRPQTRTLMILDDADQRLHTVSIDDTGLDLAR